MPDKDLEKDFPPELFPAQGRLHMPCNGCRRPGGLLMEYRLEYLDPPAEGWPPGVAAARLASACRACGSDFLTRTKRLVANLGASLAGVQRKFSAREVPWLRCEQCDHEEGAKLWPWIRCELCGWESRGELKSA